MDITTVTLSHSRIITGIVLMTKKLPWSMSYKFKKPMAMSTPMHMLSIIGWLTNNFILKLTIITINSLLVNKSIIICIKI